MTKSTGSTIEIFLEDRKRAFEIFTKSSIREFCLKYHLGIPEEEFVFWLGAHKARTHMNNISLDLIYASAVWLVERGYSNSLDLETMGKLKEAGYKLPETA